jgi:hypothetical protein
MYGAVSSKGVGPLVEVASAHKRVVVPTSEDFQSAFDSILNWARSLGKRRNRQYAFVMDNAKCHTSFSTREYFIQNQVQVVPCWPPQSPDLNIIENLWGICQERLSRVKSRTFEAFRSNLLHAWGSIEQEIVDRLYAGWDNRLAKVIEKRGAGPVA